MIDRDRDNAAQLNVDMCEMTPLNHFTTQRHSQTDRLLLGSGIEIFQRPTERWKYMYGNIAEKKTYRQTEMWSSKSAQQRQANIQFISALCQLNWDRQTTRDIFQEMRCPSSCQLTMKKS
jgi:hypothetical protein